MRHYLLKDKEVVGPVRFLEWVFNNRFTPVAKTELGNVFECDRQRCWRYSWEGTSVRRGR